MPVRFVITGFGPFAGVDDNPTQRLLVRGGRGSAPSSLASALPPDLAARVASTAVLPVSAAAARAWVAEQHVTTTTVTTATPAAEGSTSTTTVVFVHLGVNAQHHAGGFALEKTAVNCADFRVPDVDGLCGGRCCIEDGVGLDAERTTGLPLEALLARLARVGWRADGGDRTDRPPRPWWAWWRGRRPSARPPVRISTDAGRFLCNFIYFLSLGACDSGGCGCVGDGDGGGARSWQGGAATRRHRRREALFVHVPPAEVVPLEEQAAFLVDLMRAIVDEVEGEEDGGNSCRERLQVGQGC